MAAMELSNKALAFLVEAVDFRTRAMRAELGKPDLDEDTAADLANDLGFYEAIRADLVAARDVLTGARTDL